MPNQACFRHIEAIIPTYLVETDPLAPLSCHSYYWFFPLASNLIAHLDLRHY